VAQHLAVLSKDSDLFEFVGQMPGADRSTDSVNSYLSVQEGVANKSKMYASKYAQFVVSYAEEWYKVVSKRVGEGIKTAEQLRVELDHYQSKVEGKKRFDRCLSF
jgi:arginyl-tRNA synthetase